MTRILSPLITENLPGTNGRYVKLSDNFGFYSDVLDCEVWAMKGFICDKESVPAFRGTCPEGGVGHDLLSRYDSNPIVTKAKAARVYLELMKHMYSLDDRNGVKGWFGKLWDAARRYGKFGVVYVWPGYFHKYSIHATLDDLTK